jgi:hypothetical protein
LDLTEGAIELDADRHNTLVVALGLPESRSRNDLQETPLRRRCDLASPHMFWLLGHGVDIAGVSPLDAALSGQIAIFLAPEGWPAAVDWTL